MNKHKQHLQYQCEFQSSQDSIEYFQSLQIKSTSKQLPDKYICLEMNQSFQVININDDNNSNNNDNNNCNNNDNYNNMNRNIIQSQQQQQEEQKQQKLQQLQNQYQIIYPQYQEQPINLSQSLYSLQLATSLLKSTYKSTISNIKTLKTNITYSLKHNEYFDIFSRRQKLILNPLHGISLLGKVYKTSKEKQMFYQSFNTIIWFTYRKGIYGVQSDTGWGCMIRVCQMVLAQVFKRISNQNNNHINNNNMYNINNKNNIINTTTKSKLLQIIQHFKDTPQSFFSLTRICDRGNICQRWTSSIQIFSILRKLTLQFTHIPLNIDIYSVIIQIQSLQLIQQLSYPRMLFISNRLGKDKIDQQFKQHFFQIMNMKQFVGMVGGNGGEALYIVGHDYQGKVLFLDPHYVQNIQSSNNNNNNQNNNNQNINNNQSISTYFPNQPYLIHISQLAPSIGVNFIVKNKQQHIKLINKLYQLQQFYKNGLIIQIYCRQLQQKYKKLRQNKKKESQQIFEQL